ncbi:MAG: hypothetical protein K2X35_24035 [Bryobacteraceae bacterium]|nr:hypothetical protein [Bryobacteraceae bacterium]
MNAAANTLLFLGMLPSACLAGDLSTYRGFQFGMDLASAAKHAGLDPREARSIHQRPVLLQEIDWRPRGSSASLDTGAIRHGLLSFYGSQLFRIVISYDRDHTEGMTSEDMVEAVSNLYGAATRPNVQISFQSDHAEVAPVIARWEDADHACDLVRTGYGGSYALVLYSKKTSALAAAAVREALRLDVAEAPGREAAAKRKQQEADRAELQKARSSNAPKFKP